MSSAVALATLGGLGAGAAPALAGGPPPVSFVREWGNPGAPNSYWPGAPSDQLGYPTGVATDGPHIYVADWEDARVQKFAYGGGFLQSLWSSVPTPTYMGWWQPHDVALDSAGNVYASDPNLDRINVMSATGAYLRSWGGFGSAPGQFNWPCGIAVDGAGAVYVADVLNNRIQKFSSAGAILRTWGGPGAGTALGQFNKPCGVAVDSAGNLYVADSGNNRIQKLTSSGWLAWGTSGTLPGYFNNPQGIAVDRFGNVFVADTGNNRAQQFASDGTFLQQWGGGPLSTGKGQFFSPTGVAVIATAPYDPFARGTTIYLTQGGSDRVQEFWEGVSLVIHCAVACGGP
ncbi:MAG: SMP-30/gluconolactonase/LRE family protein [Solirubrobacterales bacterium]|nr:SMP-30/gluconolactonase/LRE family protein [Solirubrobacterales bacterium]MBV9940672.1 SMP-30/gluconolactonase/LRE family protein [Solirubrobacterales bacterium]